MHRPESSRRLFPREPEVAIHAQLLVPTVQAAIVASVLLVKPQAAKARSAGNQLVIAFDG